MYVQWLLEFIWRIFIQGPLLTINWFTSNGNINKLLGETRFNSEQYTVISSLIALGIILSIAIIIFIIIFIFKIIWIIFKANGNNMKLLIIDAIKLFFKSIIIVLIFSIVFNFIFLAIDQILKVVSSSFNNMDKTQHQYLSNLPTNIYNIITNGHFNDMGINGSNNSSKNPNFLFPDKNGNFLEIANNMNWIISIVFVNFINFFLIYASWSVFQKMIEVYFLYATFPISVAFGQVSYQINIKVWTKEIINKIAMVFVYIVCLRLFLYFFSLITNLLITNTTNYYQSWAMSDKFKSYSDKLYVLSMISLALGCSMIFIIKIFSLKNKEYVGIIGSIKSFDQTRKFIQYTTNNSNIQNITTEVNSLAINDHISSLKYDINKLNNDVNQYLALRKIKLFNQ